jgi:3',5'-nucleoside bisphosphate phosphatase
VGLRIDLHTHSTASDGTDTPAQVMAMAVAAGLDVVALTDHDTERGWAEAMEAAPEFHIKLVRGMEITTSDLAPVEGARPINVHLLSYLHDPGNPELAGILAETRENRDSRLKLMADKLAEDFPITWDDVVEQAKGKTAGRPHLADALIACGVFTHRDQAFATVLAPTSKYYERYESPRTSEMISVVRAAGGVPVLAHPGAPSRGGVLSNERIAVMLEAGLMGLEVYHREHDAATVERLRALAEELGLLITGSSDYHGRGKENRLGENTTTPQVYEQIVEAGYLPVV